MNFSRLALLAATCVLAAHAASNKNNAGKKPPLGSQPKAPQKPSANSGKKPVSSPQNKKPSQAKPQRPTKWTAWPYDLQLQSPAPMNVAKQAGLCLVQVDGLYLTNEFVTYSGIADTCAMYGMVPAAIGVDDVDSVLALLLGCNTTLGSIYSYQGVPGRVGSDAQSCLFVNTQPFVDYVVGNGSCLHTIAPVVCQFGLNYTTTTTVVEEVSTTSTVTTVTVVSTSLGTVYTALTTATFRLLVNETDVITETETDVETLSTTITYSTDTVVSTVASSNATLTLTSTSYYTTVTRVRVTKTRTHVITPTCPGKPLWACPCQPQKGGFVVIESKVPAYQAKCACEQLGLELADVTIFNYLNLTSLTGTCLKPQEYAWINSWNGDSYSDASCLAFYTGGAVAVPDSCHRPMPVICQVPKHADCCSHRHHHRQYDRYGYGDWCGCGSNRDYMKPQPVKCYSKFDVMREIPLKVKPDNKEYFEIKQAASLPEPKQAPQNLREDQVITLCPHSVGNYVLVQNAVVPTSTLGICTSLGLYPAMIVESDQTDAMAVMSSCSADEAWISAYRSLGPQGSDRCVAMEYVLTSFNVFRFAFQTEECSDVSMHVLCKSSSGTTTNTGSSGQIITASATLTSYTTLSFSTITTLTRTSTTTTLTTESATLTFPVILTITETVYDTETTTLTETTTDVESVEASTTTTTVLTWAGTTTDVDTVTRTRTIYHTRTTCKTITVYPDHHHRGYGYSGNHHHRHDDSEVKNNGPQNKGPEGTQETMEKGGERVLFEQSNGQAKDYIQLEKQAKEQQAQEQAQKAQQAQEQAQEDAKKKAIFERFK